MFCLDVCVSTTVVLLNQRVPYILKMTSKMLSKLQKKLCRPLNLYVLLFPQGNDNRCWKLIDRRWHNCTKSLRILNMNSFMINRDTTLSEHFGVVSVVRVVAPSTWEKKNNKLKKDHVEPSLSMTDVLNGKLHCNTCLRGLQGVHEVRCNQLPCKLERSK